MPMSVSHTITFGGLLGNLLGFMLLYKASAGARTSTDPARLRSMNNLGLILVFGGFGLQFLAAGIFMPR